MYEALAMLAVAVKFHIFILLSILGSFVPRQKHLSVGGGPNVSEVDQTRQQVALPKKYDGSFLMIR